MSRDPAEVGGEASARRRYLVALVLLLALQASLAVLSLPTTSATSDESAHLAAGYTYLVTGDHRLNPEHPPLVKLLAASPLLFLHATFPRDDGAWITAREWHFGRRFLFRWNDGIRLLFWARLPMVALSLVLTAAVFFEARRRFGPRAGALAALLCALSPDVLGHGRLVTTDLGFALFYFLSVLAFERLMEAPSAGRALAAGLATGAAFATKFSAPLLVLLLPALLVVSAAGRPARANGRRLLALAAVGAVSLGVLWSAYGFRSRFTFDESLRRDDLSWLRDASPAFDELARWRIVPEDYVRGYVFVDTMAGDRSTFLLGERRQGRFPHYYLVTFLLKTPVPLLVLLAWAALAGPRLPARQATYLWLPAAAYAVVAFLWGPQIGHRHLLPLYPFLFVSASRVAAAASGRRGVAVLVLAAWYAGGTIAIHPHYIAYFNEIGGGPKEAWKQLVDSNLDWGQDLPALKEWMDEHGVGRIKFSYFGNAEPSAYGIRCDFLPSFGVSNMTPITRRIRRGDWVAISATMLQGVYLSPDDERIIAPFRAREPVGRAGWSIRIYRADFDWP